MVSLVLQRDEKLLKQFRATGSQKRDGECENNLGADCSNSWSSETVRSSLSKPQKTQMLKGFIYKTALRIKYLQMYKR